MAMKGQRMIIATTTEYGTDEDTEMGSRVTRSVFDNYMRRPSLKDQAIHTIASMANNDQLMMGSGEDGPLLYDAAFIFMDRGQARFLISGRAAAYCFEDGHLTHRSDPAEASIIGNGAAYVPRLEEAFELKKGKLAFLAASRSLAAVPDGEIERALLAADSPETWMDGLRALVGADRQFCAVTVFPPPSKPALPWGMGRDKGMD